MNKTLKVINYIIITIFSIIVIGLTLLRLVSYCTISDKEVTSYNMDNPIINLLIIIGFVAVIILVRLLSSCMKNRFNSIISDNAKGLLNYKRIGLGILVIAILVVCACSTWLVLSTQLASKTDQLYIQGCITRLHNNDLSQWMLGGYMAKYPNQNGFFMFMYVISFITEVNNVAFQLLNIIPIVGIIICMYSIVDSRKLVTSLCTIAFIPLALYVTFVYGTLWGLFFSLLAIVFEKKYFEKRKIAFIVLSAIAITIAVLLKNNYTIFMIGIIISFVLKCLSDKNFKGILVVILFLMIYGISSVSLNAYIVDRTGGTTTDGMPYQAWIAMGLQESDRAPGWYNAYNEQVYEASGMNKSLATEMANEEIADRINYFVQNPGYALKFFGKKIASQWNNPDFQAYWNMANRDSGVTMNYHVDKLVKGNVDILNNFMRMFHLLVLVGTSFYIICTNKKITTENLTFAIIFIGGLLFHLFWEGKAQYTIVYFILLIPYAVIGFDIVSSKILKRLNWI